MDNIIKKRFLEWTGTGNPVEKRKTVFRMIRDIPFEIVPEMFSLETGPRRMLEENRSFCFPKHYLLGTMLETLGVSVKYCVFEFNWNDMDASYPPGVTKYLRGLPNTFHLSCRASLEKGWVLLDATWDRAVKQAGFTVNEEWDGVSDTRLSVRPLREFARDRAADIEVLYRGELMTYSLSQELALARFSVEVNRWLASLRTREVRRNVSGGAAYGDPPQQ